MKELFERVTLYLCFVGFGGIVAVVIMKSVLPTIVRYVQDITRLMCGREVFSLIVPMFCACGMIVYGSTKNNAQTNDAVPTAQTLIPRAAVMSSLLVDGTATLGSNSLIRVEKWWRRGAYDDGHIVSFDGDWCFPYGANHLARVEVWASGAIYASEKDMNPIAELATKLSVRPHDTEVSIGRTTNDSYRVEWRRGHPHRDKDQIADAAIELHRNGKVTVVEGDVMREIPYVIPFAHEGFGQDVDWIRANFTNAEDIIAVGYANWVDAQVGVGLENGLYKFTASFNDVPPEPTQFYVGSCTVCVTNAGDYVFLLKKGTDYEFGTWPFIDDVDYYAQDDMSPVTPILMSLRNSWNALGEWSVDGGECWFDYPDISEGGYEPGRCLWTPTLQGSPDVRHLGPMDIPMTLVAVLADYCGSPAPSFVWRSSDVDFAFEDANAQTTVITNAAVQNWVFCSMSVQAQLGDCTLQSSICLSYGKNDAPQVALSIEAPRAIFINDDGDVAQEGKDFEVSGRHDLDDDIIPVTVTMRSDVATNGTVVVRPLVRDGHLWKDEGRTTEVIFEERINVHDSCEFSTAFYLECEYESYRYLSDQITVSWEDGTDASNEAEHHFTAINCAAEPITVESVGPSTNMCIVNPCTAIVGADTHLQIQVSPESVPNNKISWRVLSGAASFPNGNIGRDVVMIAGGAPGDAVVLEVDIDDCPGRKPRFEFLVTERIDVLLYPYLITGAVGAELTESQLAEKLDELNRIYRQVGLRFSSAPIVVIDNFEWSNYGLSKRAIGREIRNYAHKTDGVEVYFIGDNQENADYETKAIGRANSDGIVIRSHAPGRVLAHEIGHVCGLVDIYIDDNIQELYHPPRESWMPSDWNNGTGSRYYAPGTCQMDLILRLLMYGVGCGNHLDIPRGSVRGLVKDRLSPIGKALGSAAVGRSAMIVFPPHTK